MDSQHSSLKVPVFDFIDIHPTPIKHISTCGDKLYVSRDKCSEVYQVIDAAHPSKMAIEQILRLQPCEQMHQIDGVLVMIKPFQLRAYDEDQARWTVHPFTTQYCSSTLHNNWLYTFHERECLKWSISCQSGVQVSHLQKSQFPYHVTLAGEIQGHGKKLKPNVAGTRFTVCQLSTCGDYLFVGTDAGHLHVYETKFLTHVKSVKRHEASILAIKNYGNSVYFTGSDSKISSLALVQASQGILSWVLSSEVRGQSHDILGMGIHNGNQQTAYLITGGITTDLCFHTIRGSTLTEQWWHKICYSSEKLVQCVDQYLFVNKFNQFEVWKMVPHPTSGMPSKVELIVRYDLQFHKHIQQLTVTKFVGKSYLDLDEGKPVSQQYMIMASTQHEAVSWIFDPDTGLVKYTTISNSYNLVKAMGGDSLLTLRDGNRLEKLDYKTGRIKQLAEVSVPFATEMSIHYNGDEQRIMVSSKYSGKVEVYLNVKGKGIRLYAAFELPKLYNILDICYYNPENILIKYSDELEVRELDRKGKIVKDSVVVLPVKKIRQHGWAQVLLDSKKKVYWYLVGEAKIIVVSGMKTPRDKKVRVKQMPRIGNVVSNPLALSTNSSMDEQSVGERQNWSLGVVALDFGKMIEQQPIKPVFTKKIM